MGIILISHSLPTEIEDSSHELLEIKVREILSKYELTPADKRRIYRNHELMNAIIEIYNSKKQFVSNISNAVMSIEFSNSVTTLADFLDSLSSINPLRVRIEELLEEDCLICYDLKPDRIFGCGHGTCSGCFPRIDVCPLCRKEITQVMVKTEPVVASDSASSTNAVNDVKTISKPKLKLKL